MKTITKTLALLFATVAFTACTNQSIEPVRPAAQIQSDTTHRRVQSPAGNDLQSQKYLSEKMIVTEGADQDNTQPMPIVEPTPYPVSVPSPRPAVMPMEQINALDK